MGMMESLEKVAPPFSRFVDKVKLSDSGLKISENLLQIHAGDGVNPDFLDPTIFPDSGLKI